MDEGKLITGRIGKPFGLDGSLWLYSENTAENLLREKVLTLEKKKNRITAGTRNIETIRFEAEIAGLEKKSGKMTIKFKGTDNPEDAKRLYTGCTVLISRKNAKPLASGEVYCSDLVGLDVFSDGQKVAETTAWMEGAQGTLLEMKTQDGSRYIVPYLDVYLSDPDLENRRIDILMKELLQ